MGVPFREEIAAGGRLTDIAATALAFDETMAQARLPELLEAYDVEGSIMPEVIQAKTEYIAARDAAVLSLESGAGNLVTFDFVMAGAFSANGWYTLDDCTTYFVEASFYVTEPGLEANIIDKTVRSDLTSVTGHAFRSTSEAPFTLDGEAHEWAPGTYPFESLSIAFDDWAVETAFPGTLTITDGEVTIAITQP